MRSPALIAALLVVGLVPTAWAGGGGTGSGTGTGTGTDTSTGTGTGTGTTDASTTDASTTDASTTDASTTDVTTTDASTTEGGTTEGDTGSTGTSGAGTDTSADTGTDDGGCRACPTGDESIAFDEPSSQATVIAPFTVSVEVVPRCPCLDCSCAAEDFDYAQLFVDSVAWGGPCDASPCMWSVSAEVGSHSLYARAIYPSGEASTTIGVVILGVDGGTGGLDSSPTTMTTTAPPSDPETSSGATAGLLEGDSGCGCTTQPVQHGWAPLLAVVWMRRRARSRA